MLIEINDDVLKSRHGNLVIYDIDYLLKHLDREIELLKKYKQDMPLIDFEQVKKELLSQVITKAK